MKVELVTFTQYPEKILREAYSKCYQKEASIQTIIRHMKHSSVLEHVTFTFDLKISRVTLEQLVRHRIASPTVQSHRYTEPTEEDCYYFVPDDVIKLGHEAYEEWIEDAKHSYRTYKKWIERGVKKESARYLLPKGVAINLQWTINLRSLLNFLTLRLDSHAQEEIRLLAWNIWDRVKPTMPNLAPHIERLIDKQMEDE